MATNAVEDRLLVWFRRGDFLELHSAHRELFAADRRQALDHVAHCPLSIFVGAVSGEQRFKPLLEVPLQVVGKRAQEHVSSDSIIGLLVDGPYFQLQGLETSD